MLDKHSEWLNIGKIGDKCTAYIICISVSTIRRAHTSQFEKEDENMKKQGRLRKLDSKAESELVVWIKNEPLNCYDLTRS